MEIINKTEIQMDEIMPIEQILGLNSDINVQIKKNKMEVSEAPVGLFQLIDGEIICITKYTKESNGAREAYIVSSGECYCGGNDKLGWPIEIKG